jgi:hypothetical protein
MCSVSVAAFRNILQNILQYCTLRKAAILTHILRKLERLLGQCTFIPKIIRIMKRQKRKNFKRSSIQILIEIIEVEKIPVYRTVTSKSHIFVERYNQGCSRSQRIISSIKNVPNAWAWSRIKMRRLAVEKKL